MAARFARNIVIVAGLIIAIMVWPVDAWLEAYRHHIDSLSSAMFHPSVMDMWSRVMLSLLTLSLSICIQWMIRRLQRDKERIDLIMHSINGGLWDWNPSTGAFACSPQLFRDTLGYGGDARGNMQLDRWMDLIHPDEREGVLHSLRDMVDGHLTRYETEMRMRHNDGHWKHFRFRAFPAQANEHGSIVRIVGTIADITEHKRVEEQYLQKAEEHTVMLATTTDGYWLVGENGLILEANAAYCSMTGFALDEVVNHTVSDFEVIETPEETAAHIQKVIASGFDRFESKHRCQDGRILDIEVSASYLAKKGQISCFFRDITERKKYKEELLRLSRIVEQTSEGVLIVNRSGIIEYVNPAFCKNTGYSEEEAVGQRPSMLKSGAQNDAFYSHMWDAISQGKSWSGSVVDRRKDGSFFPALLSIFPVHDESGESLYFVGIQRDISDLKRMEDQFLQAQKMEAIGTLVGGIAHDFNNMLAAIQASTYLARIKIGSAPEESAARLTDIEQLTKRAADMIKQMLAFARKDKMQRDMLTLNSFLKEGFKLAKTAIPENIDLAWDICEEELSINGDSTQLQQVIMNLLNNARDALSGKDKPRVAISLRPFRATPEFLEHHEHIQTGRYAHLSITDNGTGISTDHLGKVFEPFFTTKEVGEGTGLGLAMVYGVIESHGGLVEVESTSGKGTAFHIFLPLVESAPVDAHAPTVQEIIEGRGETILLVDDESSIRSTASSVLSSLGYKVQIAADGTEAMALLDHEREVALIITDVVMPRMGGMDLAEALRQSGNDIPIIFATGYDREQASAADRRIKHSAVIRKPFSPAKISQVMRRLIDEAS